MSPGRLVLAAALALWLAPPVVDVAEARPAKRAAATATKKPTKASRPSKRSKRTKVTKRTERSTRSKRTAARTTVARRGRHAPASNMPDGWSWPPNAAMRAAGAECTAALDELGVEWQPAEPVERVATPITVPSMTFGGVKLVSWFRKPPFVMDCHLALALTTFAKDLYELGVRELKFSRIYGYTLVRTGGVTKNALSRHALGLAVDVRSIIDADGREAIVERDYPREDPLLVRVETYLNDSGGFRTVLTPKNDPVSHHDHFHVEVKLEYGP